MGKRIALMVGLLAIAACSDPVGPEHTTSSGNHTTSSGNLGQANPSPVDLRKGRFQLPQPTSDMVGRLDGATRVQ